jgi:tRNA threonylcarbamoyl adenosine modification protein YjeE
MYTHTLTNLPLDNMAHVATAIAKLLRAGDVITLSGEVGAGKTTFARTIIQTLCPTANDIVSPTFMLMQSYDMKALGTLFHLDLYRLKHREEVYELGLEDMFSQSMLIEWPEIVLDLLPKERLDITIDFISTDNQRSLTLSCTQQWHERIKGIL